MNFKKIAVTIMFFMVATQVYPCASSNATDSSDPKALSCIQNPATVNQQPQKKRLANTTNSKIQDQDADSAVQEFKELIKEALYAKPPSKIERIRVFAAREFVKFVPIILFFLLVIPFARPEQRIPPGQVDNGENIGDNIVIWFFLFTQILANHFIHCKDRTLAALNNIEKYIESLNRDKKKQFAQIFEKKYTQLRNKLSTDDFYGLGSLFDLCIDCFAGMILYWNLFEIKNLKDVGMNLAPVAALTADVIVNIKNYSDSVTPLQRDALYRINKALNK